MSSKNQIEQFLAAGPIAMAGVSRDPKKFGRIAFEELTRKGLQPVPINPNLDEINGIPCYKSVSDLPKEIKSLIIMTPKNKTAEVVREAIDKGIGNIWIQQHSETPEALALIKNRDLNVITRQCILMFYHPDGFHKFHRNLKRLFGRLPK